MVSKFSILGMIVALGVIMYAISMAGNEKGIETNTVEMVQGSASAGCEKTSTGCYDPVKITTYIGNTVTWKNTDSSSHTVTSGNPYRVTGEFDSGMLLPGDEFSHTFRSSETYDYFCTIHPWMIGQVTVR